MKRICTLKKSFNDGTEVMVEFVNVIPNKNRMVVRRMSYDGTKEVNIYNNLDDERIQRDIARNTKSARPKYMPSWQKPGSMTRTR